MSMMYFIAPFNRETWIEAHEQGRQPPSDLRIDPTAYETALRKQWPEIRFVPTDGLAESPYVLEWVVPHTRPGFAGLQGSLSRDLRVIVLKPGTNKEDLTAFVLWHCSYVRRSSKSFFFHSEAPGSLEIEQDTSERDILEFAQITD